MARKLLNPNTLPAKPTLEQIRRALVDIWYLVSEAPISITADNYQTTGDVAKEILICTNPAPRTVTLHPGPSDGDEIIVKRQGEEVTIDGNGNTIDGESSLVLSGLYDCPHLVYTDLGGEWSIVGYLGLPRDEMGRVRVNDEGSNELLTSIRRDIKLLNERFEEVHGTLIEEDDINAT